MHPKRLLYFLNHSMGPTTTYTLCLIKHDMGPKVRLMNTVMGPTVQLKKTCYGSKSPFKKPWYMGPTHK